jgi:choline dehydrogenase-like flavoprotein
LGPDILPAVFIQGAGTAERTYDAIVVGSGISGGWAAKELTEKGLRTLVLERGRDVKHPDSGLSPLTPDVGESRCDSSTAAASAGRGFSSRPPAAVSTPASWHLITPDRVAGLVLADASHEDQVHEVPRLARFMRLRASPIRGAVI